MIRLDDVIIAHETKFAEFVDGKLVGEDIPNYMGESFKTYHQNIIRQLLKIKGTAIPKDPRPDRVKNAEWLMEEKIIKFYQNFKEKEYQTNDWIGAIKTIFPSRADYLNAVKPLIDAYETSLEEVKKSFIGTLPDLYQNVIKACKLARKEIADMIYSAPNEEKAPKTIDVDIESPLRNRCKEYTITYKLFVIHGQDAEIIDMGELKPDDIMDQNKTIFGRAPPEGSVFDKHKLHDEGIPATEQIISRRHGCLYFNKDGDLVYEQLGRNRSKAEDYKGSELYVTRGMIFPLFPAHFNMDFAAAHIIIYGIKQNYKLELILEKEKGLNPKK